MCAHKDRRGDYRQPGDDGLEHEVHGGARPAHHGLPDEYRGDGMMRSRQLRAMTGVALVVSLLAGTGGCAGLVPRSERDLSSRVPRDFMFHRVYVHDFGDTAVRGIAAALVDDAEGPGNGASRSLPPGAWTAERLKRVLGAAHVEQATLEPTLEIEGDVERLEVTGGFPTEGRISLRVVLRSSEGRKTWTGSVSGCARRWTLDGGPRVASGVASEALMNALSALFDDGTFLAALGPG